MECGVQSPPEARPFAMDGNFLLLLPKAKQLQLLQHTVGEYVCLSHQFGCPGTDPNFHCGCNTGLADFRHDEECGLRSHFCLHFSRNKFDVDILFHDLNSPTVSVEDWKGFWVSPL